MSPNIVLMNEFTNTNFTRGKTPANFVRSYTARDDATLTTYPTYDKKHDLLYPTNNDTLLSQGLYDINKTIERYDSISDVTWQHLTPLDGRVFNQNHLSLSKDMVMSESLLLQKAFDEDHTVMKMVVSFDRNYLYEQGILQHLTSTNLENDIDETKLRIATRESTINLAEHLGYTQPLLLGSIQLDKEHPHAHIVLVESADKHNSRAHYWYDGCEIGTISKRQQANYKQHIHNNIQEQRSMIFYPSNQVKQLEAANKEYNKTFSDILIKKNIMLAVANPEEPRIQDKLLETITTDIMDRQNITSKKSNIKNSLKQIVSDTEPTQPLSPILDLQFQQMGQLYTSDKRFNRTFGKMKRKKRQLKEKQQLYEKDYNEYLTIKRFEPPVIESDNDWLLKEQILPYYEEKLILRAYEIDTIKEPLFKPVGPISDEQQRKQVYLNRKTKEVMSPFDKTVLKEDIITASHQWHNDDLYTAHDIMNVLQGNEHRIPPLKTPGIMTNSYKDLLKSVDHQKAKDQLQYLAAEARFGFELIDNDYLPNSISHIKEVFMKEHPELQDITNFRVALPEKDSTLDEIKYFEKARARNKIHDTPHQSISLSEAQNTVQEVIQAINEDSIAL